jgi:two-component system, cell cycle sensor histidine kinase and response regulator CckA
MSYHCIIALPFPATNGFGTGFADIAGGKGLGLYMSSNSNGITLLVVEDAGPLCKLISSMLRKNGYTVLEAGDGAEALAIVAREQGKIDLVLTDVIMPHMDGSELAHRLSQLRPELPVLFMSGYTDDPVVQQLRTRPRSLLRKPFNAQVLVDTVRQALAEAANAGN